MSGHVAQASDAEARRAAQTVFDRPVILEAGAGTGKTTTLVARILAWILGPGWIDVRQQTAESAESWTDDEVAQRVLDGVVAITFTEAAAAEMAARLTSRLSEIARHGETSKPGFDAALLELPRSELMKRAAALLGVLERVTLSTIHAFCNLLLRRHALARGLHPDFVIDAREDLLEEVAREVVEQASRAAYAADRDGPVLRLAAAGIGPRKLVEALTRFTAEGTPASVFADTTFSAQQITEVAGDLRDSMRALLDGYGERLLQVSGTDRPARIHAGLEATLAWLETRDWRTADTQELAALSQQLQEIWDTKLLGRLGDWQKQRFTKGERNAFESSDHATGDSAELAHLAGRLRLRVSHLAELDPVFLEQARAAIYPLLSQVEQELRSRGIATFQSLLVETRELLRDPRIRAGERGRIRQLLVDEFQDTDELQCEIVRLLSLDGPEEQRPGLFVVGDPKQSIYAWRNADLAAYEDFVNRAVQAGGERFSLVTNFRSAPEILAEVERAVEPVMREVPGLQPPFETLVYGNAGAEPEAGDTRDGFEHDNWSAIEYWISWHPDNFRGGRTPTHVAAEIEAEAIAADILRLRGAGHSQRWSDFALLFRSTHRLDEYLSAFRDAGIPFVVTSDKQYYRRREVIEAAALVRTIVQPMDHIALVTYLRSASVGVPDAAWIPLWQREFPGLMTELVDDFDSELLNKIQQVIEDAAADLPADVPGLCRITSWERNLSAAVRGLARLRTSFARDPVDRFVERLRTELLIEATESARYLGAYRVANLERFFRRLESALTDSRGDAQSVLRALRRSVAEARDDEEALPKEAAEDAVQIMTIHKAKGLEFPHVYVVQLHAGARASEHDPHDADRRPAPDKPCQYVLFNRPSLLWDRVEADRVESAAAEQVRTLYVALTRAQRRLVLVGNWSKSPKPVELAAGDRLRTVPTHLKLLGHRAPVASMGKLVGDAGGREGWVDPTGVRWKLAAHLQSDTGNQTIVPAVSAASAGNFFRRRSVQTWADELRDRRETAARIAERPLFASASGAAEDDLEQVLAEAPITASSEGGLSRFAAQIAGKIVHHALETWKPDGATVEFDRQQRRALDALPTRLAGEDLEAARAWVQALFSKLAEGRLLPRLIESAPSVVARELPVLLPRQDPPAPDDAAAPVCGWTGTIDLLLRDESPGSGHLIVDFKTDQIESDEELQKRAAAYTPQIEIYRRAVQSALDLPAPPAAELWFLWPDRVWPVS